MTLHMQKFPASRQVPLTSEGKEFGFSPAVRPYQVENNAAAANVNEQLTGVHTEEKVAVNSQVAAYAVMQMIASGDLFAGGPRRWPLQIATDGNLSPRATSCFDPVFQAAIQ
jgi:hypothetical protein